jgi:hypothetical protein
MFSNIGKPIHSNDAVINKLRRNLTAENVMNEWVIVTRMLAKAIGIEMDISIKRVHEDHIVDRPRVYAAICRTASIVGALATGSRIDLTKQFEMTTREKQLEEDRDV